MMLKANNPKLDALVEQIIVLNEFISKDDLLVKVLKLVTVICVQTKKYLINGLKL